LLLLCAAVLPASRYERRQNARAKALRAQYGMGSQAALSRRLIAMRDRDQDVRRRWLSARGKPEEDGLQKEMEGLDARLTGELEGIVGEFGWPAYDLVGYDGATAAMTVLVHSPSRDFQRRMLVRLRPLADTGRIPAIDVAILTDKLLLADGKRQLYGTQFRLENGAVEMEPVEDPARLDERRAAYDLMPMKEYRRSLEKMYKVKKKKVPRGSSGLR